MSQASPPGLLLTGFSLNISHGANFEVTVNDDSIKYSSTNDDDFIQVATKKKKANKSTISAAEKKVLNRKINAMVVKNEKSRTAKRSKGTK